MAKHNEILTGRHNRLLQKLFSMKGEPPAPQLTSEITPVHPFMSGRENRYLEAWNLFWTATAGIVGAAGQSPTFRIINPVGSNVMAVIEKLTVGSVAADIADIAFETNGPAGTIANLGSVLIAVAMDGRTQPNVAVPLSNQGVCIASTNTNTAAAGTLVMKKHTLALQDLDLILTDDQEILLPPASLVNIFLETAASTLFVSIMWRERFLEDSERS